tara:strand:- start:997 stop:1344 length:348 start_codon:yes stop_codon:yes gene_type:complete
MTDEERISEDDFLIRVRPVKENQTYTGEANFSVISCKGTDIPVELYDDMEYVVKCMLSTIPLMESDTEFRNFVTHYVEHNFSYEFDERDEDKVTIESVDGNVITINFNSDTKGTA